MIGSAVGAGLAVYGMIQARKARKRAQAAERKALEIRRKNAEEFAQATLAKGITESDLIRSKAVKYRGSQMAQQAASGVVVGNGSAQAITERTLVLGEADALVAIEESKAKAKQIRFRAMYDGMETGHRIDAMSEREKVQNIQTMSRVASSFG